MFSGCQDYDNRWKHSEMFENDMYLQAFFFPEKIIDFPK